MKKLTAVGVVALCSFQVLAGNDLKFDRTLELSADRLSAVELDVGAGSLEVIGTSGNEIKVYATIESDEFSDMAVFQEAFEDKMAFSLKRDSGYALLKAKSNKTMNWGNSKNIAIHLEVEVPRHMDLVIDDGSGSMTISDIDGTVKIDDGSGSITIHNIGNDVEVDDGSGSLKISDVNGDVEVDDGSGSVTLTNIAGTVDIEDGSGSIDANGVAGDFKVDDGSGDVVVKNLEGEFKLIDDGSGGIKVNGQRWSKR